MGEKREIVCRYVFQGLNVANAILLAGIKKSAYYYKPNGRPKGKKPSTHTYKGCELILNENVVEEIIKFISPEYNDYGYKVCCELLKRQGYKINKKKVRRLMSENNLLHPHLKRSAPMDKLFIKYTSPSLEGPFCTIEADIKYIHIHEQNRNAFLITFLCTFCRYAPVWELEYMMRNDQIRELVLDLIHDPDVKRYIDTKKIKIYIRTDNGPQFIAKSLAITLNSLGIIHEFINPGTPQENGHIESFHNTLTRLVCNRNIFKDIGHARNIFSDFYDAYNNTRVMQALLYYSPKQFLRLWEMGIVGIKKNRHNKEIFFFREKPSIQLSECGSPREDLLGLIKNNNFITPVLTRIENSPV